MTGNSGGPAVDLLGCVVNSICEDLPMTAPRICHQPLVRHEGCIHFPCLSDISYTSSGKKYIYITCSVYIYIYIYICTVWFGNFREGFIFTFFASQEPFAKLKLQIFGVLMYLRANCVSIPSSNVHMHIAR